MRCVKQSHLSKHGNCIPFRQPDVPGSESLPPPPTHTLEVQVVSLTWQGYVYSHTPNNPHNSSQKVKQHSFNKLPSLIMKRCRKDFQTFVLIFSIIPFNKHFPNNTVLQFHFGLIFSCKRDNIKRQKLNHFACE